MSSISSQLMSFARHSWHIASESAIQAILPIPILQSIVGIIDNVHPSLLLDAEPFPLTNEGLKEVTDKFLKYNVVDENEKSIIESLDGAQKKRIRALVEKLFNEYSQTCNKLNLLVQFPVVPYISFDSRYALGAAVGNQWIQVFSSPVIIFSPYPSIIINSQKTSSQSTDPITDTCVYLENQASERAFITAHLFARIMCGDNLASTILLIAKICLNALIWIEGLCSSSLSLKRILFIYSRVFLFEIISFIFHSFILRARTKRTDLMAMDILQTNEGALSLFGRLKNQPIVWEQPSAKERLAYAKNWRQAKVPSS